MKAWRSHTAGGPESLMLEEVDRPEPGPGEVLVRIRSVGINFPDGLLIRDRYQVRPTRPFIPGGEFSGVIEKTGADVDDLRSGDMVVATIGWGALAEYAVVAAVDIITVHPALPSDEAAAFFYTHATAYFALQTVGSLRAGETLVVLGAGGGVGSAAVSIGHALGATVIAGASSEEKVALARARGASKELVYESDLPTTNDQKKFARALKALAPGGIDVVFDPVGGPYAEPALRSIGHRGRYLVVGFAAGIPSVPLNVPLLRSAQVLGIDWRSFGIREPAAARRDTRALFELWRTGLIAPVVTERHDFTDAPAAIARVEAREALGKIVVTVDNRGQQA